MDAETLKLMAETIEATPFEIPGARGEFRIQILNEDQARGVVTTVVHLPAGGVIPAHFHRAGAEMHYVLEGDLIEAGQEMGVGAFLTHAPEQVHGPHESRGGAKVLTVQLWQSQGGSFDFNPAEGSAPAQGEKSGGADARPAGGADAGPDRAGDASPVQPAGRGPAVVDDSDVNRDRQDAKGYA